MILCLQRPEVHFDWRNCVLDSDAKRLFRAIYVPPNRRGITMQHARCETTNSQTKRCKDKCHPTPHPRAVVVLRSSTHLCCRVKEINQCAESSSCLCRNDFVPDDGSAYDEEQVPIQLSRPSSSRCDRCGHVRRRCSDRHFVSDGVSLRDPEDTRAFTVSSCTGMCIQKPTSSTPTTQAFRETSKSAGPGTTH